MILRALKVFLLPQWFVTNVHDWSLNHTMVCSIFFVKCQNPARTRPISLIVGKRRIPSYNVHESGPTHLSWESTAIDVLSYSAGIQPEPDLSHLSCNSTTFLYTQFIQWTRKTQMTVSQTISCLVVEYNNSESSHYHKNSRS